MKQRLGDSAGLVMECGMYKKDREEVPKKDKHEENDDEGIEDQHNL